MDNNLFKQIKAAMDTIENESINKVYLLNHNVNLKAQLLNSLLRPWPLFHIFSLLAVLLSLNCLQ